MQLQIFYDKKIPKVNSNHSCLAVINLDSALKKDENYYLKEYQYIVKKVIRYINNNLRDFSSSDESDEEQMVFDKYLSWLLLNLFFINTETRFKIADCIKIALANN